jgi:hypothetical protein
MRTAIVIALLALWPAVGHAQNGETPVLGFGKISCGTWLESATNEGRGAEWFLGFWSGGNAFGEDSESVGATASPDDLIAVAKARCRASETSRLIEIATEMFREYRRNGN